MIRTLSSFFSILSCLQSIDPSDAKLAGLRIRGLDTTGLWLALFVMLAMGASSSARAQTTAQNAWTWVNGSGDAGSTGVYGTKGTPAASNVIPGRANASGWLDQNGNIWIFGGTTSFRQNDMWEFNPSIGQWAWMSGTNLVEQPGVYGTQGTPAASNTPGAREGAASWTDTNGNLWLFGGDGYDAAGTWSNLNDLWKFNSVTAQWRWVGGSSTQATYCVFGNGDSGGYCGAPGIYGTLGAAATTNMPGSRYYAATFTDKSGNLWLFGGIGDDSQGSPGWLNDLWEFNPASGEWTWMAGDNTLGPTYNGQSGVYGSLGVASAANTPGGRYGATGWTDAAGNLWLFGGYGFDSAGSDAWLNDLWEFDISSGQWTWVGGSSSDGIFGGWTTGVPGQWMTPASSDMPSGRFGAAGWTDGSGRLWLYGGSGIYDDPIALSNNPFTWYLNDLWMFDPSTKEWTWMDGDVSLPVSQYGYVYNPSAVYGTQGTPSVTNLPSMDAWAVGLTDSSDRFWLFGGAGGGNNLWVYQPGTTNQSVAAAPIFSPASGAVSAGQTVQISDSSPGATIYYTIGENAPPIEYAQPIPVSSSETIMAFAAASGLANSIPASAAYTVPATATPSFSLAPGEYTNGQTVSISDATPNSLIYYTIDGTTPTTSSTQYQTPIAITSSETIEAVAIATGYTQSVTAAAVYTIWPTADVNEWAWMSGPNAPANPVWGSLGVPSINNNPGLRALPASWTDPAGNLWMFGGNGYDAHDNNGLLNDLWEFTPTTNQWTWMGGSNVVQINGSGQPGVYGTQGTPAAGNIPPARQASATWTDSKGNFWLYGGSLGTINSGNFTELNDLWKYNESSGQWTWVNGSQATSDGFSGGATPVYGTLGQAAPANNPGARDGASTWIDGSGDFWLFGGHGLDPNLLTDYAFNDLWKFSPSINEWTWMGGSDSDQNVTCGTDGNAVTGGVCGHIGTYGTLGSASAGNNPGGRSGASSWIDVQGNLWLFGGVGFPDNGNVNPMDDLWEFTPSTVQWTWKGGNDTVLLCIADTNDECTVNQLPVEYGTQGIPAAGNMPMYAAYAANWTDINGNFWLYGGSYSSNFYYLAEGPVAFIYGWNDLWEYSPSANEWSWMGGTEVTNTTVGGGGAVVGSQGLPNPANSPGPVLGVPAWTDVNGNLWMFNGLMWKLQPSAPAPAPSFTLTVSSASISATAPGSGNSVLTTLVSGGFNSAVALSASGQPSGVTVAFSPASISGAGSSQVTISVGASVATGSYPITITGTSGAITETAIMSLTVTGPPPGFTFSASPASLTVDSGASGTSTLSITSQNGFSSAVSFACSGLPVGVTCSFSPTTVTPQGGGVATTTMTFTASASAESRSNRGPFLPVSGLALAALLFVFSKRRVARAFLLVLFFAAGFGLLSGCGSGSGSGGGGGGGTTPTVSTVTLTATSGSLQQTTAITLTLN